MRLAIVASHAIQYQAPLFRALGRRLELDVFFAHKASKSDQAEAGFGVEFEWDVDLYAGYRSRNLRNVSNRPGLDHFSGCDAPEILKVLRQGHYDAILVMGWHLKCYWQAIFAAKRLGIPVMVRGDSQTETPRNFIKRAVKAVVYPFLLQVFDAGLYVGNRSKAYWMSYGYDVRRLFFSPHCVDNEWFAKRATVAERRQLRTAHGIPEDAHVVLFAGKLVDFKRPTDVMAAATILKAAGRNVVVLVAGSGPLESAMSEAALQAGIRLVSLGFCNQSLMPAVYAAADVLVLPSNANETWGLVANEALACGRPIITSDDCGCSADLAADGVAGESFPMGDTTALAHALARVLDHPPAPSAIAERASLYSLAASADGIVSALRGVSR